MDSILFEHQEAALCAQHALNMLLQSALFSVQELTEIAKRLDQEENSVLDLEQRNQESQNMNDSGYFSIQVISEALKSFDLHLTNIEHPSSAEIKADPLKARAFICNHREHWFVLRKFGNQWFELNSIKRGPRVLSDTYVAIFLHQLSAENYSIFIVDGVLPDSEADQLISLCPVVPEMPLTREKREPGIVEKIFQNVGKRLGSSSEESSQNREDQDLAIAMAMSMENRNEEDDDMEKAIKMSLEGTSEPQEQEQQQQQPQEKLEETPILQQNTCPTLEQQRKDREAFLKRFEK